MNRVQEILFPPRRPTHKDIAEEAGIHESYLTLILQRKRSPSSKVVARLAEAMDVTPEEFIQFLESRKDVAA